jgi:hypothetical protein
VNRGDWWALELDVASVSVFDYAANIITIIYISKLLFEKVLTRTPVIYFQFEKSITCPSSL